MRFPTTAWTVLLSLALLLSGSCSQSLRPQAKELAKAGSTIAGQLQQFYGLIEQDVIDTYELDQFRAAYDLQAKLDEEAAKKPSSHPLPTPPTPDSISELDKQLQSATEDSYNAIEARARLAGAIKAEYDAYAALASYDASTELVDATNNLIGAAKTAAAFAVPDPTGTVASVAQALLTDIVKQLGTVRQNKALLRQSSQMIALLQKFKQFFDTEKVLYEGDVPATDSSGRALKITGIAGRKALAYRSVATDLVKSEVVISTGMVERVLVGYDLSWPASKGPFTEPALKAGIVKMMVMKAYPIGRLATDAGGDLSKSLGNLVTLHQQLAKKEPPSFADALADSATLQAILERMKVQSHDVKSLESILKSLGGSK